MSIASSLIDKTCEYWRFMVICLGMIRQEQAVFGVFIVLSIVGALTEGLSVSMLVPILQSQQSMGTSVLIPARAVAFLNSMGPSQRMEWVATSLGGVLVVRGFLQYAVCVLGALIPLNMLRRMSMESYSALMAAEISLINSKDAGTLMNGLGAWQARSTQLLTDMANIIWNIFLFGIYGAMMLIMSLRLSFAAILFVVIASLILRAAASGPLRRSGIAETEAQTNLNNIIHQSVLGMKMIRLSTAEVFMERKFGAALGNLVGAQRRTAWVSQASYPFLAMATGLFICSMLFGVATMHGEQETGWVADLLLFLFVLSRLLGPVTAIHTSRSRVIKDLDALEQLRALNCEILDRRQASGPMLAAPFQTALTFEKVSFSYENSGSLLIDGFDVTIRKGEMVALVGPSGAGKSTVLSLVCRLYDPVAGRVLADGIDLRDLDIKSWRRRLAVVSQDTLIFNDTVYNNICFGQTNIPREDVIQAAQRASAADFIDDMPEGYDTKLGERGVSLSGGQQQRIAIARAILADPDILILDEATSQLDTVTENAIRKSVESFSKGRTTIVVAHRLSTIVKADRVLVMRNGRVIEEGTHTTLIAQKGFYAHMIAQQGLDICDDTEPVWAPENA
ncbi:MAG TPA: ABC transporter ATP-binding protein [Candidatus Sulfotelmatobacter sp.]|jgi:ABC-type multidrug transport system fused ATPase/permease subunit|nr:ABC transporter ATP-binding protein [Candidatus Sulfotelmatobacter sp.]